MTPVVRKAPPPVPIRRQRNTLEKLWAQVYLIWMLDALLLITAIIGVREHRSAMQGVGKDGAPSIIAAQHIKAALADMDADAANELLGEPGREAYDKRRDDVAQGLIDAAKNITYGEDEEKPIKAIQVGLGKYEEQIQHARDLRERPVKGKPEEFVDAYRVAAATMDEKLLPQAQQLDKVNDEHLQSIYVTARQRSVFTVFLFLAVGIALLLALVSVQKFLTERTHRILNPLLVAASLIALSFVLYTFSILGTERNRLKVAKEDAFDSISALIRAEAVAYAANADESRYLLDTTHAQEHQRAFFARVARIVKLPVGMSYDSAVQAAGNGEIKFRGFLADELNNITFDGERQAALNTLEKFGTYLAIDGEIRQLEQSGKHAEAIELCVGNQENQSNWAFDQFDKALGATVAINQKEFGNAVATGFAELANFEVNAAVTAIVIAILAFFGMLKRIREYQ